MKYIYIIIIIVIIIVLIIHLYQSIYTVERFTTTQSKYELNNIIDYSDKLLPQDIINLKKGQTIMTNMLYEFDKICRKHNIMYWCVGETLIGSLRHRGWVPWGAEVYIGIVKSDYEKLRLIVDSELPNYLIFQHSLSNTCSKIIDLLSHYTYSEWSKNEEPDNGLQLDIFVFDKIDEMLIPSMNCCLDIKTYNYDFIFPLKETVFEDIIVYIPNEYKMYCTNAWDSYPPVLLPIDKRYPHKGTINPEQPSKKMLEMYKDKYTNITRPNKKQQGELNNSIIHNTFDNFEYSSKLSPDDIIHLKQGQLKMSNMLKVFDKLCTKYKVRYFLIGGSLIGTILYKGWIPWDGDVDLQVNEDDYVKLKNALINELPSNMWFQDNSTDKYYPSNPRIIGKIRDLSSCYIQYSNTTYGNTWHNGVQIDIVIYKTNKNGTIYFTDNTKITDLTIDDIYPIKRVPFENFSVNIMKNSEKYLLNNYGKEWFLLLPKEYRIAHEGKIDGMNTCDFHYTKYPNLHKKCTKLSTCNNLSTNNKGKIAFLFLTRDNINNYDIWKKFLKGNEDKYSIYVHPKYPQKITQQLIKDNIINETIETGWGTIGAVRANLLMLKYALMDPNNMMFILVSESCMPIQNFNNFYNFIFKDMKSYICYFIQFLDKYDLIINPQISREQYRKHNAQGLIFNRTHASLLYENDMTKDWENIKCVDEIYFYNIIIQYNSNENINNYKITFDEWCLINYDFKSKLKSNPPSDTSSLSTFTELNDTFINTMIENGYYFMRKVDRECKFDNLKFINNF